LWRAPALIRRRHPKTWFRRLLRVISTVFGKLELFLRIAECRVCGTRYSHRAVVKTGVIAPKTTSMLERIFRDIGRRIKPIARGWSDDAATKLSKMIILKKYSKQKWEQFWKQKLNINGYFSIEFVQAEIRPCHKF